MFWNLNLYQWLKTLREPVKQEELEPSTPTLPDLRELCMLNQQAIPRHRRTMAFLDNNLLHAITSSTILQYVFSKINITSLVNQMLSTPAIDEDSYVNTGLNFIVNLSLVMFTLPKFTRLTHKMVSFLNDYVHDLFLALGQYGTKSEALRNMSFKDLKKLNSVHDEFRNQYADTLTSECISLAENGASKLGELRRLKKMYSEGVDVTTKLAELERECTELTCRKRTLDGELRPILTTKTFDPNNKQCLDAFLVYLQRRNAVNSSVEHNPDNINQYDSTINSQNLEF